MTISIQNAEHKNFHTSVHNLGVSDWKMKKLIKERKNISGNPVKLGHTLSWHYICTLNLGLTDTLKNLHLTHIDSIHNIKMYSMYLTKNTFLVMCFGMTLFSQIWDTISPTLTGKDCFLYQQILDFFFFIQNILFD